MGSSVRKPILSTSNYDEILDFLANNGHKCLRLEKDRVSWDIQYVHHSYLLEIYPVRAQHKPATRIAHFYNNRNEMLGAFEEIGVPDYMTYTNSKYF